MNPKITTVLAIMLVGYAIASSWLAHADDPVIHDATLFCHWLDEDHSQAGVARAVNEFEIQKVPTPVANEVVRYALTMICPQYAQAFQTYYDAGKLRKI